MLGAFGWNTGFESIMPRGHEILTERALNAMPGGGSGSVNLRVQGRPIVTALSPSEVNAIVEGNRAVDVADLAQMQRMVAGVRARPYLMAVPGVPAAMTAYSAGQLATHVVHSVMEDDQKRHALRRNPGQAMADALREIVGHLRQMHREILLDPNPQTRLGRLGAALHLIQDSYCPAHTERSPERCIRYIRNYGGYDTPVWQRGGPGREHSFPADPRDNIAANPLEAGHAIAASRQYLQIVFKILYARGVASLPTLQEANVEFEQFVQQHFRPC